ncbi:MAG: hypothetical protein RBQ91_03020 [Acholeplasma sp.]|nr:hypothetical protein [Acholeplasma sp.]HKL61216.1 hypothetical protein [Acholeplasma sp.]
MKKILSTIGSYFLDPIRKVGLSRISDSLVNYSNKNPWFKSLVTFLIVGVIIVLFYAFEINIFN